MRDFRSSVIFILGCIVFAVHEAYSIRGLESTIVWHLTQYVSVLLYLIAGIYFGVWFKDNGSVTKFERNANGIKVIGQGLNWHDIGEVIAVALLGIIGYVFFLHYILSII